VVGNRDEFDENGVVPVHYGVTKRFIGEKEIMLDKIYANTKGKKQLDQRLDQHLFAVGYLAKLLVEKLFPNEKSLAKQVYISGCWHDMGKIDSKFQKSLISGKSYSLENYPRHHEVSLLLFKILFDSSDNLDVIEHGIFWHHEKPKRKKEFHNGLINIFTTFKDLKENHREIFETTKAMLSSIDEILNEYDEEFNVEVQTVKNVYFDALEDNLEGVSSPRYKQYSDRNEIDGYYGNINKNARNNIARTAIISADYKISSLSSTKLNTYLSTKTLDKLIEEMLPKDRDLKRDIKNSLEWFDKEYGKSQRNIDQQKVAKKLSSYSREIPVLRGPAGCGKTKIALEWAMNTSAKKIYWICPRVQVCQGIFEDLCSKEEGADRYLPNTNIEIVTGEDKRTQKDGKVDETKEGEEFSSESHIIITTIDQIINTIIITTYTYKGITTLVDFLDAHVVFDEFHEYVNMKGFNFLFAELIACKRMKQDDEETLPDTLLVSATPHTLFVEKFLGIKSRDIISIESFNQSRYKIDFKSYSLEDEINPLTELQKEKSVFIISNTATTAQMSFINHQDKENAILFHSKFIKKDKRELFQEISKSFKKNGTQIYDILRSGPVVQASLNISAKKMISEMSSAENILQRLGRLDRFGLNPDINHYTIAISEGVKNGKSKGKNSDSSSYWLNELFSLKSSNAWYEFLHKNLEDKTYTINEIYGLYDEFYRDDKSLKSLEEDLLKALEKSIELLNSKIQEPVSPFKNKEKNSIKIKRNSLRGDNLFVQMAQCKIDSLDEYSILEEYAYDKVEDALTLDKKIIEKDGNSSGDSLLHEMAKIHLYIVENRDIPKNFTLRKFYFKKEAIDPSNPIFVSYKPTDLKLVKANQKAHENAYYYAQGLKQPIGIIQLNKLEKGTDNETENR
jgi:CRISPR-associated endonuclease/helicase Cas3